MTYAIALIAGTTIALLVQWREWRILKRARLGGYGEGWNACEEHRRAHCPDVDPDEMFDAGYKCGLELNVIRQPQSDDWQRGFKLGFELGSQDCPRRSSKPERTVN